MYPIATTATTAATDTTDTVATAGPAGPELEPDRSLMVRLYDEWQALRVRPSLLRRAVRWGVTNPDFPLVSLDDLLVDTGFRRYAAAAHPMHPASIARAERVARAGRVLTAASVDITMGRLLVVARTDELAARVVLQRLLPGLMTVARRWPARREGGSDHAADDVIGAAWTVIREYPVESRSRHLVANLLRDCEYRAFIRPTRRLLVHEMTAPSLLDVPATTHMTHATHMTHMTNLDHAEHSTHSDPLEELIAVLREAPDLTAEERRLLGLLLSGLTTVEVADVLHVSERTVRTYRAAMVERLRQRVCEVAA